MGAGGVRRHLLLAYWAYWHDGFYLGPRFMLPLAPWLALWTARFPAALAERPASLPLRRAVLVGGFAALVMGATKLLPLRAQQYRNGMLSMRFDIDALARKAGVQRGAGVRARKLGRPVHRPDVGARGVADRGRADLPHHRCCRLDTRWQRGNEAGRAAPFRASGGALRADSFRLVGLRVHPIPRRVIRAARRSLAAVLGDHRGRNGFTSSRRSCCAAGVTIATAVICTPGIHCSSPPSQVGHLAVDQGHAHHEVSRDSRDLRWIRCARRGGPTRETAMTKLRLAIIIPAWNEAARLHEPPFSPSSLARTWSTSDSWTMVAPTRRRRAWRQSGQAPERIVVQRLEPNRGKGEAVRLGLLAALDDGYPLVGYLDADLAAPLDTAVLLRETLLAGPALAMVLGSRIKLLGWRIRRSERRHYLGRIFATCASLALGLAVYDTQCGAKALRAGVATDAALATPFLSRWLFDVELLARLRDARGLA